MNIESIFIGMKVIDNVTKFKTHVLNKTSNSVEVYLKAWNENGINCTQWFTWKDFNDRFKIS